MSDNQVTQPALSPERAAEVQRLLRRQRTWLVITTVGLALSLVGYVPSLLRYKSITKPEPTRVPDFEAIRPTYVRNFYVEPDGMGFRVAFALAGERGEYCIRSGRAFVTVIDDRYGYSGQELVTVKRDSFAVSAGEFLMITDPAVTAGGTPVPVSPPRRVALEKATVSAATAGCYVQLCFVTTDGDTLRARKKTSWPWM
jgi:hypothetical protein